MSEKALLSVRALSIRVRAGRELKTLVDSISFDLGVERLALVGESGSGKSITARALLGLVRKPLSATAERLEFGGRDLQRLTPAEWARERGASLSLVVQDPRHALNPVLRVGTQLEETLRIHQRLTAQQRRLRIEEMLDAVGLSAGRVLDLYPHQLSGGMGQRVMLAMMLINGPQVLIADEPTSALDAELRDQALELMSRLVGSRRMGLLLISHDLPQVARYCDRVLVINRGRIVDECAASALGNSQHPYTRALWSCKPSAATYGTDLPVLPVLPDLPNLPNLPNLPDLPDPPDLPVLSVLPASYPNGNSPSEAIPTTTLLPVPTDLPVLPASDADDAPR